MFICCSSYLVLLLFLVSKSEQVKSRNFIKSSINFKVSVFWSVHDYQQWSLIGLSYGDTIHPRMWNNRLYSCDLDLTAVTLVLKLVVKLCLHILNDLDSSSRSKVIAWPLLASITKYGIPISLCWNFYEQLSIYFCKFVLHWSQSQGHLKVTAIQYHGHIKLKLKKILLLCMGWWPFDLFNQYMQYYFILHKFIYRTHTRTPDFIGCSEEALVILSGGWYRLVVSYLLHGTFTVIVVLRYI